MDEDENPEMPSEEEGKDEAPAEGEETVIPVENGHTEVQEPTKEGHAVTAIENPERVPSGGVKDVNVELHNSPMEAQGTHSLASSGGQSKPKASKVSNVPSSKQTVKKVRKTIYISYSPDAGFIERKFVCETVRQFKEINLAEDIWFDKDESNTDMPSWFSQRMESVEKCRAAICFLSNSYFQCPVSVYEMKVLTERQKLAHPPKVFSVLCEGIELPRNFSFLTEEVVNLAIPAFQRLSLAEKASVVIGSLVSKVEPYAIVSAPHIPSSPEKEFTEDYKTKKICRWTTNDIQSWLFHLGIREFYRQSFAESEIDGFMLMTLLDEDMLENLSIDSRVVRKKLLQQVDQILKKEYDGKDNWHLRARNQKPKADMVYLIYDPSDVRLAQNLKQDLKRKGLQVSSHEKLGQSKEEFLQINGPHIATAKFVVVLLTEPASISPFVFHEVLFTDWLGKSLVTLMFKNVWDKLRPALKAVLGESMAIDFETKLYIESLDVLEHQIKPLKKVPGVVLEQSYLNRMTEGIKPLKVLSSLTSSHRDSGSGPVEPRVFISYQWDAQNKVAEIRKLLENHGIPCFADSSSTISQTQRGHSGANMRGASFGTLDVLSEGLQSHLQRNMKSSAIIMCCITPRYLQSDNCLKDIIVADSLNKPIVPILLRFVPWPPDISPTSVKKILARTTTVDFSNEKLFKQNFHLLLDKLRKYLSGKK